MLTHCMLCPRNCGVDRTQGEIGFCGAGFLPRVALASLHAWEEPCISGTRGSGTVFFSECSLRCVFCQNHEISWEGRGKEVSIARLAEIFLEQQQRGAENINLVTPTHYAAPIAESLALAKRGGLTLPVVYNSSAYENPETIEMLSGRVNIFLPDLKYFDDRFARKYSGAPSYFRHAALAVETMVRQVGKPVFDDEGRMISGVIVRHLALPGLLADSKKIVEYLFHTFGHDVYISLMNQYTPCFHAEDYPELAEPLPDRDYEELVDYAISLGVENGFIQEGGAVSESFIPSFNLANI